MKLTLDPHPFARRGTAEICWVSLMHLFQAFLMAIWPTGADATGIIALKFWAAMGHQPILVPLMAICAAIAIAGAICRVGWIRILLFLPQQYLLGVTAFGGLCAALQGAYLDHTPMDWPHITNDQVGFAILFGIHTFAIVRRARDPNG